MAAGFQRARKPGQKEQRRQQLLAAAARLLRTQGLDAVTLTAIAAQGGLAKSNVYRYFESREQILLEILVEDERVWVGELEHALAPLAGSGNTTEVAAQVARTLTGRKVTCVLIAVVAQVLEHNLSPAAAHAYKQSLLDLSLRIRNALHAALPDLPHAVSASLLCWLQALVAGLWPMSHPSATSAGVMSQHPELAPLHTDFEADLKDALAALLRGLQQPAH